MATKKISDLTELTSTAQDDVLAIVDTSANETKKIKVSNLVTGGDEFFVLSAGAYLSSGGTFFYLPISGVSQTESATLAWYHKLPLPANARLVDVALIYQRGATGRTLQLNAYDFSISGQGALLGGATNGPLAATSSTGGNLVFNFNTSAFDYTSTSQVGLGISIGGTLHQGNTVLGCTITMRFKLT